MRKQDRINEVLNNLDPRVQNVINKVITAEREKLHLKRAKGIKDEIRQIIRQEAESRET